MGGCHRRFGDASTTTPSAAAGCGSRTARQPDSCVPRSLKGHQGRKDTRGRRAFSVQVPSKDTSIPRLGLAEHATYPPRPDHPPRRPSPAMAFVFVESPPSAQARSRAFLAAGPIHRSPSFGPSSRCFRPSSPCCCLLRRGQRILRAPQRRFRHTAQNSRGKLGILRRTPAGFTATPLDEYGLRDVLPTRPVVAA